MPQCVPTVHTVFGIIAMRKHRPAAEKPLYWVGSSKKDLLGFPEEVVDNIGYALGVVQYSEEIAFRRADRANGH